jgi:crotonobetainyl-CoA:carnitine CoA-transferase CaiB-like acyl-CoA transferase
MTVRPLTGIRVLDLTSVVVGPACTLRLADYGAEVIKLEPPEGDILRTLGGPSPSGQLSGKYLHFNRNKRAICLDLKKPEGRAALPRLLDYVDVFVSNMRPEALGRLGLDAKAARATRPKLVHCTITGFGPGGPYRGRPAYDSVVQGVSGVAGLSLHRDGTPRLVPLLMCDHVSGEIAAGAILAALLARERSGVGAAIEVPMLETMAAFVLQEHLGPATFLPALGPPGDHRVLDPNNRPVATKDGWITLTSNTDAQCHALLRAIGRPELIEDPRFATVADRFRHARDWFALRAEALAERTTEEWLRIFEKADVPATRCHTLDTLPDDPHLAAVELLVEQAHPTEGAIRMIRPTVLQDGEHADPGRPARQKGADTRAVLAEAGFSETEIGLLLDCGAAVEGPHES